MLSRLLAFLAAGLLCAAPAAVHATSRSPGHQQHVRGQSHTASVTSSSASKFNSRPVIGILTQAGLEEDTFVPVNGSYIAASYIKFVEGGGARAVPLLHDSPPEVLDYLFSRINGLLIPGGAANLRPGHTFYDAAARLFNLTLAANEGGDTFPVMGICLGFETLMLLVAGTHDVMRDFDSEGTAAPLYFTSDAPDSRFFTSWDLDLALDVLHAPLTRESHSSGVRLKEFEANAALAGFYKPLSLSVDKEGRVYISTIEAKQYPIVGLQWHPEKNSYEWSPHSDIPHGYLASEVTHQAARFLVNEARSSAHSFADVVEEDLWLVYNDPVVFSGRHLAPMDKKWAEQAYVFPEWAQYQAAVQQRAKEAGRQWMPSTTSSTGGTRQQQPTLTRQRQQ